MKTKPILMSWIITIFFYGNCFAADPTEERTTQLASILNITNNTPVYLSVAHIFSGKLTTIQADDFLIRQTKIKVASLAKLMDVEILDLNNHVVAVGHVIESTSFEMARKALLEKLVLNSMSIEMLARKYEVRYTDIGDLCIIEKTFDQATKSYSSIPVAIHFIRGCTAISLFSSDKAVNILTIAKAIDKMLTPKGSK